MNWLKIQQRVLLINGLIGLTGCVNTSKEAILPQTGPTMKDVYDRHFAGNGHDKALVSSHSMATPLGNRRIGTAVTDLSGYTRESFNETRHLFQRLPNPDLVMYVYPHLSGPEGNPVPGYSTVFPFYETVHYALPGEVDGE
jgi:conjugative transfer region lipoprotein (TIGR03751 family)